MSFGSNGYGDSRIQTIASMLKRADPPEYLEKEAEKLAKAFFAQFSDEDIIPDGAYREYLYEHGSEELVGYLDKHKEFENINPDTYDAEEIIRKMKIPEELEREYLELWDSFEAENSYEDYDEDSEEWDVFYNVHASEDLKQFLLEWEKICYIAECKGLLYD